MTILVLGLEFYFANTWIDGRTMRVVATGFVSNPGSVTETHDGQKTGHANDGPVTAKRCLTPKKL